MAKNIRKSIENHHLFVAPTSTAHADITPLSESQFRVWRGLLGTALAETPQTIAGRRSIRLQDLFDLGVDKNQQRLKEELIGPPGKPGEGLVGKVLVLNAWGKDKGKNGKMLRGSAYALMSYLSFDERAGYLVYEFSESLSNLVLNSKIYSMISASVLQNIDGKRALGLYTFLNDYAGIKRTPLITVEQLKQILGIEKESYPEFKRLSLSLKKVMKHLEERTDIKPRLLIKYGPRKVVEGVMFEFDFQTPKLDANIARMAEMKNNPTQNLVWTEQDKAEYESMLARLGATPNKPTP